MTITKTDIYLFFCYSCVSSMIVWWIYKYTWYEKLVTVDYKDFYESKDDVYPIMSLCFKNPFQKETWNETEDTYDKILKQYLAGEIDLKERKEKGVTFDLTNYVLKYWVLWNNGRNKTYDPSEYKWMTPKIRT